MKTLLNTLRGCLVITLMVMITIPAAIIVILIASIAKLMPIHSWKKTGMKVAMQCPKIWISLLTLIMKINSNNKWDIQGPTDLQKEGCYLLISNHISWVDILILNASFNRKIPFIKFFMKKELKWTLPVAGIACWLLDYPFMERHTRAQIKKNPALKGKDIETTRQACRKLKEHPNTLVNFVEGTRFRPEKQKRQNSPYQNLLKPKAGGVAIAVEELGNTLTGIIDSTIYFPGGDMSFWKFVSGDFSKLILRYQVIHVTPELVGDYYNDREFRSTFQTWLNSIWIKKDNEIAELRKQYD